MQIPAGGPLRLTSQGLLPFHWCASLPDHVLLPSANSIQHKNTTLTKGVQPLQPLQAQSASQICFTYLLLAEQPLATQAKLLKALGFWREMPIPPHEQLT